MAMKFLSVQHEGDLTTPQVRVRELLLLHRWLFHLPSCQRNSLRRVGVRQQHSHLKASRRSQRLRRICRKWGLLEHVQAERLQDHHVPHLRKGLARRNPLRWVLRGRIFRPARCNRRMRKECLLPRP